MSLFITFRLNVLAAVLLGSRYFAGILKSIFNEQ